MDPSGRGWSGSPCCELISFVLGAFNEWRRPDPPVMRECVVEPACGPVFVPGSCGEEAEEAF
ncbi:MAG: hypothetical protein ACRDZZ_01130, partial [Ilumatobacteraceae bacterium]